VHAAVHDRVTAVAHAFVAPLEGHLLVGARTQVVVVQLRDACAFMLGIGAVAIRGVEAAAVLCPLVVGRVEVLLVEDLGRFSRVEVEKKLVRLIARIGVDRRVLEAVDDVLPVGGRGKFRDLVVILGEAGHLFGLDVYCEEVHRAEEGGVLDHVGVILRFCEVLFVARALLAGREEQAVGIEPPHALHAVLDRGYRFGRAAPRVEPPDLRAAALPVLRIAGREKCDVVPIGAPPRIAVVAGARQLNRRRRVAAVRVVPVGQVHVRLRLVGLGVGRLLDPKDALPVRANVHVGQGALLQHMVDCPGGVVGGLSLDGEGQSECKQGEEEGPHTGESR
jgi:hypothetical protein